MDRARLMAKMPPAAQWVGGGPPLLWLKSLAWVPGVDSPSRSREGQLTALPLKGVVLSV